MNLIAYIGGIIEVKCIEKKKSLKVNELKEKPRNLD